MVEGRAKQAQSKMKRIAHRAELVRYDAMCHAIAECHRVDEAKKIADKATAICAYARQAKNPEIERMAAEIRLRAKRRLGQLTRQLDRAHKIGQGRKVQLPKSGKLKADVLKEANLSTSQAHRCEQLASVSDQEFEDYLAQCRTNERVASSDALTSRLIREIKRSEIAQRIAGICERDIEAITGAYDVIVIDPPWPMKKIDRDTRSSQTAFDYPIMQEDELKELLIPAADDCHVWLWTTHKYLPMGFRLLSHWQLDYVCTFVWHKPGGFQPFGLPQYNCEFALYAHQGAPFFTDLSAFKTCFQAPRTRHSEKPEEFYRLIRRVTQGRRLDMFSRRPIEGFDGWGNELEALAR